MWLFHVVVRSYRDGNLSGKKSVMCVQSSWRVIVLIMKSIACLTFSLPGLPSWFRKVGENMQLWA